MLATECEVAYAEHLCSRSPSFEKVRFMNSGTEAVMVTIKASRAFTGRPKIAKVEGAYHGAYDYAEVSQITNPTVWGDADRPNGVPVAHGTPAAALNDVIILPFNNTQRALELLEEHADELACVLLDPMPHRVGMNPIEPEFLTAMRNWTKTNGSLLVFDEVITYRSHYGGLQMALEVEPDLTAMGKMIGGGFPVGGVAGRADVMDLMNPKGDNYVFPYSGTFSANPISMTAGHIAMRDFDPEAVNRLNKLGDRARKGIAEAAETSGARACVTGTGSILRVHMKQSAPRNFREAYTSPEETARLKAMLDHLFSAGMIMINTCTAMLSTPMSEVEIDELVAAVGDGFDKIAKMP